MSAYNPSSTIREALNIFFEKYNLGEDGGLNKNWAYLDFGSFRIPFPNTSSRKRALIFHDIHHIVTGYKSDWQGEAEIAAWEVSSGCGNYSAAWVLDIWGMAMGLCFYPRATYRAFIRGKRTLNLYHYMMTREEAMSMKIEEMQNKLLLNLMAIAPATAKENFSFLAWSLISLLSAFVCFVLPYVLVAWWCIT